MCVAPSRPPAPSGPPPLTAEEKAEQERIKAQEKAEREAKEAEEKRKQEEARENRLEQEVAKQEKKVGGTGGTGAQSLLTGSKGGKGYFDGQI